MISVSQGKLGMCTYSESRILKLFIQANDQIDGYPLLSHHPHYYLFYSESAMCGPRHWLLWLIWKE